MAPSSKVDRKATTDVAAWMFNVVSSVGIIIVNKALMSTYGFSFAKLGVRHLCKLLYRWNECQSNVELSWILPGN
ncbi:hypothetical protein SAY86_031398 [Trapa natans]|uniref:Uncharacterized protein n=1 Tax=Trapa natans TaxID=22666 RepID=A0AAN7R7D0_TRANT|nr:hypothetical protein SAY86_031398 [Trapa natans]